MMRQQQVCPYFHYGDAITGAITSEITSLTSVYSTAYSHADQRKHQRGIHRGPVNSPHKWLVTRKMFPFDDVIMDESPLGNNELKRSNRHIHSTRIKSVGNNHVSSNPTKDPPYSVYSVFWRRHHVLGGFIILTNVYTPKHYSIVGPWGRLIRLWRTSHKGLVGNTESVSMLWRHHEQVPFHLKRTLS